MCDSCRLSGKSDECVYEDTKKKPADKNETTQRREILPTDTPSSTEVHPASSAPHDPPEDLVCVLPAHLSKLHPLVAAFTKRSSVPSDPFFNAVSNISLDDLSLAL